MLNIHICVCVSIYTYRHTHPCNHHLDKDTQNISITIEVSFMPFFCQYLPPFPEGNHYSDLYHHRLVLPVFEFHINGKI